MDLVKDHRGEGDRRSGTIRGGWVIIEEEDREVAGIGTSGSTPGMGEPQTCCRTTK